MTGVCVCALPGVATHTADPDQSDLEDLGPLHLAVVFLSYHKETKSN